MNVSVGIPVEVAIVCLGVDTPLLLSSDGWSIVSDELGESGCIWKSSVGLTGGFVKGINVGLSPCLPFFLTSGSTLSVSVDGTLSDKRWR